jgi:hypothetical protein
MRQNAVNSSLSFFEEYYKEQVAEGYISENGTPLKCRCSWLSFSNK